MYCILSSEMANGGRPLFPGNDIDDQLRRIFKYPLMEFKPFSFNYWYRCPFLTLLGKITTFQGLSLCTGNIKAWETRFCLLQRLESNPYSSFFFCPRAIKRPNEPNKVSNKSEEPKCAILFSLGQRDHHCSCSS